MDMMNGSDTTERETATATETSAPKTEKARPRIKLQRKPLTKRQNTPSSIGFPYRDLETGVAVAQAILGAGGVALTTDQLAGVMGLQAGSGNFVVKTATARMFGLVSYLNGKYELTDTGFAVLDKDDKRQRQARATAFLNVPLYRRTYEEFKGKQLPPRPTALEQAFVRFGVSPKQKDTARLVFDKSAQQAGFFAAGNERLIEPIIGGVPPIKPPSNEDDDGGGNGNGRRQAPLDSDGPDVSGFHPFVQGLLDTLPEPGTNWAIEGRAKWLSAAANIFDLIYMGSGEILITAKPVPDKE